MDVKQIADRILDLKDKEATSANTATMYALAENLAWHVTQGPQKELVERFNAFCEVAEPYMDFLGTGNQASEAFNAEEYDDAKQVFLAALAQSESEWVPVMRRLVEVIESEHGPDYDESLAKARALLSAAEGVQGG